MDLTGLKSDTQGTWRKEREIQILKQVVLFRIFICLIPVKY